MFSPIPSHRGTYFLSLFICMYFSIYLDIPKLYVFIPAFDYNLKQRLTFYLPIPNSLHHLLP